MDKQYQIVNGTAYDSRTNQNVITALEFARTNRIRIRIYIGDTETGKCWNEEHDIMGYVGRSTGNTKIPLLIYNERSNGGGGMLDYCILKIKESKGNRVLYQAPNFQQPNVTVQPSDMQPEYAYNVNIDGELYGRCKTYDAAMRLQKKMR